MNDYDYIRQILNLDYLSVNQDLMVEEKYARGHKDHRVKINSRHGTNNYSLYEFGDKDNFKLFPFFNKNHSNPSLPKIPEKLYALCDYIMLVDFKSQLYILLIELKRSKDYRHAKEQLDAAESLMDFVLSSAERIKKYNSMNTFDKRNVKYRKIIVEQVEKEAENSHFPKAQNLNDYITYKAVSDFSIRRVLEN